MILVWLGATELGGVGGGVGLTIGDGVADG